MTAYCRVVDGQIVEGPKALPRAWRNVSGLDRAPADKLIELGWYPVVKSEPPFNPATEALEASPPVVGAAEVTITFTVRALTQEELDALKPDPRLADGTGAVTRAEMNALKAYLRGEA